MPSVYSPAKRRARTEALCAPLAPEDCVIQPHVDASPARWHLAHTSWFFETFVLARAEKPYRPYHPDFGFLFNSYYNAIGARTARPLRGMHSRPTVQEVLQYRHAVNERIDRALASCEDASVLDTVELGLHHEQQHQELLLADIKAVLFQEPLFPAYCARPPIAPRAASEGWTEFAGGTEQVGHAGPDFCFDNELGLHEVLLRPFRLANELVSCGEFHRFIYDGGYTRPEYWLSDGWDVVQAQGWCAPQYWVQRGSEWFTHTLHGLQPMDPLSPVAHISYYEADAYARYAGKRLPTELEWEQAARQTGAMDRPGSLQDGSRFEPLGTGAGPGPRNMIGEVWEWTQSAYLPYPGFRPAKGAVGEYNGKFMVNQMVLRGGSVATPVGHMRLSYRNFFHPDKRWQFTGLRLAEDA